MGTGPEFAARFDRGSPSGGPGLSAPTREPEDRDQDEDPEREDQCDQFLHLRRVKPRCLVCPLYLGAGRCDRCRVDSPEVRVAGVVDSRKNARVGRA